MKSIVVFLIFLVFISGCLGQDPVQVIEAEHADGVISPIEDIVENTVEKSPDKKSEVTKPDSDKFIIANPLDLSKIKSITKFRSCCGHDYSGTNADGEEETLRSMKHYITPKAGAGDVDIFSPFDGKIVEFESSDMGTQIYISSHEARFYQFIYFHVELFDGIERGSELKAGQHIGYFPSDKWENFDFSLKKFGMFEQLVDSPFLYMSNSVLAEYSEYGVTPDNIIFSKSERDNNLCVVTGYRDGSADFASTSGVWDADSVVLG